VTILVKIHKFKEKNLPIVEEKAVSTPKMNIEVLVDAKIKEYISQLDKKSRLEYQNDAKRSLFFLPLWMNIMSV
jgi:hypothetical protein